MIIEIRAMSMMSVVHIVTFHVHQGYSNERKIKIVTCQNVLEISWLWQLEVSHTTKKISASLLIFLLLFDFPFLSFSFFVLSYCIFLFLFMKLSSSVRFSISLVDLSTEMVNCNVRVYQYSCLSCNWWVRRTGRRMRHVIVCRQYDVLWKYVLVVRPIVATRGTSD